MNRFTRSLTGIAASAGKAFVRYPAAMISALVIALSASWLVQLDAVTYGKPYQSLQLAFLLAAALGLAVTAAGFSRRSATGLFLGLNLATLGVGLLLFFLIKSPAGDIPQLTIMRILVVTAILLLAFLLLISRPGTGSDFNQAAFMMLKSAMIALLYGLVIMLGLYFIAFTVQSLLYQAMSSKVYQHTAIWSAFLAFAFFLGYFPDFTHDATDPHLETAQRQPRFAEILFQYVLVPLITILTGVLLIWAIQILAVRTWPAFAQLTGILSAYELTGIWLYIMVSRSEQPAARFFRRVFPPAMLVLLAFEAYAIFARIREQSVKPLEYTIVLVWIYALVAGLLFLRGRSGRTAFTAVAGIVLLAVAVMPLVGYQDTSVAAQSRRLQSVLERNQMLAGDRIQPAPAGISSVDKTTITDAVSFLLDSKGQRQADWFKGSITGMTDFNRVFGFPQTYPESPDQPGQGVPNVTYLMLPNGSINISGYQLLVRPSETNPAAALEVRGQRGLYGFSTNIYARGDQPALAVTLDGRDFLLVGLTPFLDNLATKYMGMVSKGSSDIPIEDMILRTEQSGVRLMFVFSYIEINGPGEGRNRYQIGLNSVFIGEG